MPGVQIETAFNVALDFEVAPFHKRLLAYLIDFAILISYMYFMKYFLYSLVGLDGTSSMGLDILIISMPMLFYSLITETTLNGQTFGKKILGIRVMSIEGGEPAASQFVLRWITKFFEWPFLFGYVYASSFAIVAYIIYTGFFGIFVAIIILISKSSQRIGDYAAGTVVVDTKTSLSIQDTIFVDVRPENYVVSYPEVMRLSDNDINTIKSVLIRVRQTKNYDICMRVEYKIKEVLKIESQLSSVDFLERLLEDYNYLATRE